MWRVLSISGTAVTLVHAGIPECYYHQYGYSVDTVSKFNNRASEIAIMQIVLIW